MLLRLQLRPRDELLGQAPQGAASRGTVTDSLAELRKDLLDCLRLAPALNLRQNEGLKESMSDLLRESKAESKYDAASKAQRVIDELNQQGIFSSQISGAAFLQQTADEMCVGFHIQCALFCPVDACPPKIAVLGAPDGGCN